MAAEYQLVQNFEMTNVARSSFNPSLTLIATGGFQSIELDKLLDANSLFATFLGRLTQPIFNKRRIKTQYEVSKAQQDKLYLISNNVCWRLVVKCQMPYMLSRLRRKNTGIG